MAEVSDRELEAAVKEAAEEGRVPCARALKLARQQGVSPRRIGKACNRAGVKIVDCQLGCFG
jgi:hypothetical protein